jgi:hypothetical protein
MLLHNLEKKLLALDRQSEEQFLESDYSPHLPRYLPLVDHHA